jgi:hypothetical protein
MRQSRRMRWAENVARKWQIRITFRTSVGQPERKRTVLNCWVLHPVARVSTNAFLKLPYATMFLCSILLCTTYCMFRPRLVAIFREDVHKIYINSTDPLTYTVVTLIYILCTFYLKMAIDRGRNM